MDALEKWKQGCNFGFAVGLGSLLGYLISVVLCLPFILLADWLLATNYEEHFETIVIVPTILIAPFYVRMLGIAVASDQNAN